MSLDNLEPQENEVNEPNELSVEDRARQLGWHPKEEYKGDPDRWVDAESFVKKGEEELPVLRSNLKKIQSDLAKEREEFQRTAKEFREWHETTVQKAEREAYERAKADIERKKLEAVEMGDKDAYIAAQEQEKNLAPPKQADQKPAPQQQDVDPAYVEWKSKNTWYDQYPELAVEAENVGIALWQSGKYQNTAQVFDQITQAMKRKYPQYFHNQNRDAPAAVNEGGEPGSARKSKARTYENLPKAAKDACERFLRNGMIKSREDYVKSYDWE